MTTHPTLFSPLFLLAALGLLATAGARAAAADTSQWKCEKCPFPAKGTSGTVDTGIGHVSDNATSFGNYTGLQSKGAHLVFGGSVTHRGDNGYYAGLSAADLGIDTRSLSAQAGREGLYSLQLGYAEIPRYFSEDARTPFLGNGGNTLGLPRSVGFPAATTAAMPLGSTLQPIRLGYEARRFDLGGKWIGQENWSYRVSLRRDVRDGIKSGTGSFFSTASQFATPVDHTTDQIEVSASYVTPQFQATLAYQLSQFRNGNAALTWDNPFLPVQGGDTRGQLALAPGNQFHQIVGSAGYQITPTIRASADIAFGQGTQNAGFLAPTLNTSLRLPVAAMPTQSLDGKVDTFNFNAKLTAAPMDGLRLNASYARDVRDNRTAIQAYPQVATDIFLRPALRSNVAFDLIQDRFKLGASYRGPASWKLSGGIDWNYRQRSYQEVVTTRETTAWGRATVLALEQLALTFNASYADRDSSTYGTAYWFGYANNPLMRKYNLAPRERGTAGARADWTVSETVSLGFGADWTNDDYKATEIGLNKAESVSLLADISVALSERTKFHAFAQVESINSRQTGSQLFSVPDWTGKVDDRFQVFGLGVTHAAIPDKLDIGADLSISRSRSDTAVQTALAEPPFPQARTALDSVKLHATYKLKDNLWLTGSWWYERYDGQEWRLDGVMPATLPDLLLFGQQTPQYRVNVLRVALRYRF